MAKKKLKFSSKYRTQLSEKLMDLGNLIAIALIFGQFVSDKEFLTGVFIIGIILTVACYIMSFIVHP